MANSEVLAAIKALEVQILTLNQNLLNSMKSIESRFADFHAKSFSGRSSHWSTKPRPSIPFPTRQPPPVISPQPMPTNHPSPPKQPPSELSFEELIQTIEAKMSISAAVVAKSGPSVVLAHGYKIEEIPELTLDLSNYAAVEKTEVPERPLVVFDSVETVEKIDESKVLAFAKEVMVNQAIPIASPSSSSPPSIFHTTSLLPPPIMLSTSPPTPPPPWKNVLLKAKLELYGWTCSCKSVREMSRHEKFLSIFQKSDSRVQFSTVLAAPNVALLKFDYALKNFIEAAGTSFPIFIGLGLKESSISDVAMKAWFSVAKNLLEDIIPLYDFDKVSTWVVIHPVNYGQSNSYGPLKDKFVEDYIISLVASLGKSTVSLPLALQFFSTRAQTQLLGMNPSVLEILVRKHDFLHEIASLVASGLAHFKNLERVYLLLTFLKSSGVSNILKYRPSFLYYNLEDSIKIKTKLFQEEGFSSLDVCRKFSNNPSILELSQKDDLALSLSMLQDLRGTQYGNGQTYKVILMSNDSE